MPVRFSERYELGRLVGGMLAGSSSARERFDRVHPGVRRITLDLVDHLDGIDEPAEFARALADYEPTASSDGAAVDALLEAYERLNVCG